MYASEAAIIFDSSKGRESGLFHFNFNLRLELGEKPNDEQIQGIKFERLRRTSMYVEGSENEDDVENAMSGGFVTYQVKL